jgi:hypothetical protein
VTAVVLAAIGAFAVGVVVGFLARRRVRLELDVNGHDDNLRA